MRETNKQYERCELIREAVGRVENAVLLNDAEWEPVDLKTPAGEREYNRVITIGVRHKDYTSYLAMSAVSGRLDLVKNSLIANSKVTINPGGKIRIDDLEPERPFRDHSKERNFYQEQKDVRSAIETAIREHDKGDEKQRRDAEESRRVLEQFGSLGALSSGGWNSTPTTQGVTKSAAGRAKDMQPEQPPAKQERASEQEITKPRRGGPRPLTDDEKLKIVQEWYGAEGRETQELFCSRKSIGTSTLRSYIRDLTAKGKLASR